MKYCGYCGTELPDTSHFCPKCGKPFADTADFVPAEDTSIPAAPPKPRKRGIFLALAAVLVVLAVLATAVFFIIPQPLPEESIAFSDDPAAISNAAKSVVMLNCYDKDGELYATGSGFAFFQEDIIVTNYHVIADEICRIEASTETGESFSVEWVLAYSEEQDIAILGVNVTTGLTPLTPGDSNAVQKGDPVYAVGYPLGLAHTISDGIISSKYTNEDGYEVLQTTAPISSGSSGGALFNNKGEVLGITYASYEEGQNLNLAIPIEVVTTVWETCTDSDKQTISEFFESQMHVYTVDYVIAHYDELWETAFYVEGWVFSHRSYQYSDLVWAGSCTLYSSVDDFPATKHPDSFIYEQQHPEVYKKLCVIIESSTLFNPIEAFETMQTGDYVRAKVHLRKDSNDKNSIISLVGSIESQNDD